MKVYLEKLAAVAQTETYITYDELNGWPRERLENEGYLKPAASQTSIPCDQCEERCPIPRERVVPIPKDKKKGLYICEHNPDVRIVEVAYDRYKQWRIIKRKLQGDGYLKEEESVGKEMEQNNNDPAGTCRHSDDFLSVTWYGQSYVFNRTQAQCIKVLWEQWEKDCPLISEKTIGEKIGSSCDNYRLINTFRSKGKIHPAWNTMIHGGGGKYKLDNPPHKKI